MARDRQSEIDSLDAPLSLKGFFPNSEDSCDDEDTFQQVYEEQGLNIMGQKLYVRQFSFHPKVEMHLRNLMRYVLVCELQFNIASSSLCGILIVILAFTDRMRIEYGAFFLNLYSFSAKKVLP